MTDAYETNETEPGNEIVVADGPAAVDLSVEHDIMSMKEGNIALVSSISTDDFEGALEVAEAIGNSSPLDEHLGQPISLRDYVVQKVSLLDAQTGSMVDAARVTLITNDGEFLHATSKGVFSSLRNLIGLVGTPDRWPNRTLNILAVRERTRSGFNTILLKPAPRAVKAARGK